VACGERPTARVVAVAGPRVANAGNYLIPFGAEIAEVLAGAGTGDAALPVAGSAMTGQGVLDGAVVGPAASKLLGLPPLAVAVPTPCIRCGWCTDNCPARLNVAALNDDFELARVEAAERRGALACVGCGICTYVCPARLPLSWRVGQLARTIHRQRKHQGSEKGS
jgi:electron transport complex protein RnfC